MESVQNTLYKGKAVIDCSARHGVSTGEQKWSSVLTDMINRTGAELSVELLGPEAPEVLDGEGPEVQHIVPREGISLLQQHHLGPQEGQLDGRT